MQDKHKRKITTKPISKTDFVSDTIRQHAELIQKLAKQGRGLIVNDCGQLEFIAVNSLLYCYNDLRNTVLDANEKNQILLWSNTSSWCNHHAFVEVVR